MRVSGIGAVAAGLALAACNPTGDTGYVEIRTVPATIQRSPALYLDKTKLEPVQKGIAVLKQRAGTTKLSAENHRRPGRALCDIVVRKNRITTVTVSVLERPPRCQCRNSAAKAPASVSRPVCGCAPIAGCCNAVSTRKDAARPAVFIPDLFHRFSQPGGTRAYTLWCHQPRLK